MFARKQMMIQLTSTLRMKPTKDLFGQGMEVRLQKAARLRLAKNKPQWRMKTWKVGVVIVVALPALVRALLILLQGSVVVDEGALQVSEVSGV